MANVNFFSPDGGITRYPLEDTEGRTTYEEEIHGVNLLKPAPYLGGNPAMSSDFPMTYCGLTLEKTSDGKGLHIYGTYDNTNSLWVYLICANADGYLNPNLISGENYIASCYYNVNPYNLTEDHQDACMLITGKMGQEHYLGSIVYEENVAHRKFTMDSNPFFGLRFGIRKNKFTTEAVNFTVYGMLRKADIEDSTYRPYNPQAIQNQLNAQGVLGAKNLLPYPYGQNSRTDNGVTYTVNTDGSVTVNGTATANSTFVLQYRTTPSAIKLEVGRTYRLTGGKSSQLSIGVSTEKNGSASYYGYDSGNGLKFMPQTGDTSFGALIQVTNGSTVNNVTVYPMLRLASDPDDTYQPYAMTNRELTEKKIDAELTFVTGVSVDTLTENKRYYCSGGMTGLPTGNIGYLDVRRNPDRNAIHQTFYPAGAQGEIYVRRFWDNAWGSWYKFTGTVVS